jgi:hypothetical protein
MGIGLETDIESGQPLEVEQLHRRARQEALRAQTAERHQRLLNDLSGQGGAILQDVAARLAARINELVKTDPEAHTLMQILEGAEQQLLVGERLAQDALEKVFAREGLTIPTE